MVPSFDHSSPLNKINIIFPSKEILQKQIIQMAPDENRKLNIVADKNTLLDFLEEFEKYDIKDQTDHSVLLNKAFNLGLEQIVAFLSLIDQLNEIDFTRMKQQIIDIKKTLTIRLQETLLSLENYRFFEDPSLVKNPLKGKRILLVEDMPYNRLIISKILAKHQVELTEVENGEEAIEEWGAGKDFDLILMDMNMPVMDGFTATEKIREKEQKSNLARVPIIALTALAMRGDREKCIAAGCDEYLSKPIDSNYFIQLCSDIVSKGNQSGPQKAQQRQVNINSILLKTQSHIVKAILPQSFLKYEIETTITDSQNGLLELLAENTYDLIVLNPDLDLQLAYYIKKLYPQQHITFIMTTDYKGELLYKEELDNLKFPFIPSEINKVLESYSIRIQLSKKLQDELNDFNSLESVKSQHKLKEATQKSDGQLAVWQKSFRKIGGDLILSHEFNYHGRFGLILADVAGHDIKSGYTASWFSGLVEGVWEQNSHPAILLRYLNNLFNHETEEEDKRFVCALVLLWDRVRCQLYYANTGIPGGIIVRKGEEKGAEINWKGLPIGLFADIEMFDQGVIDLNPGDRLYIATDGVLEAIPNEVLQTIGNEQSEFPVQEALDSIVDFVTRSIQVTDDLTIAAFEAKPLPEIKHGFRESIRSDFEAIDQLIKKTEKYIDQYFSGQFEWEKVALAFREALINAVEHGNQNDPDQPVDVDVIVNSKKLTIIVSDVGGGFDLKSIKNKLEKEGSLRIHGRGVEMIEKLTDKVSFKGGGVKMSFNSIM